MSYVKKLKVKVHKCCMWFYTRSIMVMPILWNTPRPCLRISKPEEYVENLLRVLSLLNFLHLFISWRLIWKEHFFYWGIHPNICKTMFKHPVYPYIRTYIHTYIHTPYVHTYMHIYVHTSIRTFIQAYIRTYITYIHMYIHTYMHIYIYIYVYIYIQRTYSYIWKCELLPAHQNA